MTRAMTSQNGIERRMACPKRDCAHDRIAPYTNNMVTVIETTAILCQGFIMGHDPTPGVL